VASRALQTRLILLFLGLPALVSAQEFKPGYIDPQPILTAASAAIGEDRLLGSSTSTLMKSTGPEENHSVTTPA
jgi:hypothetical protein